VKLDLKKEITAYLQDQGADLSGYFTGRWVKDGRVPALPARCPMALTRSIIVIGIQCPCRCGNDALCQHRDLYNTCNRVLDDLALLSPAG